MPDQLAPESEPTSMQEPSRFAIWRRRGTLAFGEPPIYRRHHYLAIALFVCLVSLFGPLVGGTSASNLFLVDLWLSYTMTVIGFYWIFSLAGRFAFCQTFMMALGGYTCAWVTGSSVRMPWFVGILAAMFVAACLACVVGLCLVKAPQLSFAIGTLAVTGIGTVVFTNWTAFTGAGGTVVGVEPPSLFGYVFSSDWQIFWLFLAVVTILLVVGAFIERSPVRREAISARDNRLISVLSGVRTARVQLALFMLGSVVGGLSGALMGSWQGVVANSSYGVSLAIGIFLMLILGGQGSIWGAVIGAAFYVIIPQLLVRFDNLEPVIYGSVLLIVMILMPQGLTGIMAKLVSLHRALRLPKRASEVE